MHTLNYQTLFRSLPGLHMIIAPDLTIITASDAYLKATLTERENFEGRPLFEVFPDNPEDLTADGVSNLHASIQTALRDKVTHIMPLQRYDVRSSDGSFQKKFWMPVNQPVLDDQGEVMYIIHTAKDVTSEITSEQLFTYLFENNPASTAITRLEDSVILNVNACFLSLFGFTAKEEVIGKTSKELGILMDPEKRESIINQMKNTGSSTGVETKIELPNHTFKWISTYVHLVDVDGAPCMMAVSMDITNRKEQEELLRQQASQLKQANEELETFSYSVSHDLKAPLRSLEGFSKLLIENYGGKFDEDADRWLRFISENANRMGVLINDILNFSRISRSNVNKVPVNMQSLVEQSFNAEKINYSGKTIDLYLGKLEDADGDRAMLAQVWQNLISNALKYSSKKELISIRIDSHIDQDVVVYTIRDNGVGFDEKYKDKLFGVFQRLHRSEEFEGTGVGLAIVNRIIQKHNGRIDVSSVLGEGTTFVFALPIVKEKTA